MIRKIKYGNIEDVTVVELGHGTTRVVNSRNTEDGYKSILLASNSEPKNIGEVGEKFPTSDEFNPEVSIVFWSEESFSVFEEFVKNIRKEYDEERSK